MTSSGCSFANADEIVVVADLTAFQRDLNPVEGPVIAVRYAEGRARRGRERQARG
jgi:hypothetical protein